MIFVENAKYIDSYKIQVIFNDHKQGIVDLHDTIFNDHRKVFQELQDVNKFKQFRVDMDTVVWENGLDLAPEYLYYKIINSEAGQDLHRYNSVDDFISDMKD